MALAVTKGEILKKYETKRDREGETDSMKA